MSSNREGRLVPFEGKPKGNYKHRSDAHQRQHIKEFVDYMEVSLLPDNTIWFSDECFIRIARTYDDSYFSVTFLGAKRTEFSVFGREVESTRAFCSILLSLSGHPDICRIEIFGMNYRSTSLPLDPSLSRGFFENQADYLQQIWFRNLEFDDSAAVVSFATVVKLDRCDFLDGGSGYIECLSTAENVAISKLEVEGRMPFSEEHILKLITWASKDRGRRIRGFSCEYLIPQVPESMFPLLTRANIDCIKIHLTAGLTGVVNLPAIGVPQCHVVSHIKHTFFYSGLMLESSNIRGLDLHSFRDPIYYLPDALLLAIAKNKSIRIVRLDLSLVFLKDILDCLSELPKLHYLRLSDTGDPATEKDLTQARGKLFRLVPNSRILYFDVNFISSEDKQALTNSVEENWRREFHDASRTLSLIPAALAACKKPSRQFHALRQTASMLFVPLSRKRKLES